MGVTERPTWLALLKAEAERTSIAAAARKVGYARASISLALAGRYPAATDALAAKVERALGGRVDCPFAGTDIPAAECDAARDRPASASNPGAFRQWRACRVCPRNGNGREKSC